MVANLSGDSEAGIGDRVVASFPLEGDRRRLICRRGLIALLSQCDGVLRAGVHGGPSHRLHAGRDVHRTTADGHEALVVGFQQLWRARGCV